MYVGKKYSASKVAEVDGAFTCKGCRYTSPVRVMGIGEGTGNSPYFLDDVGAEVRAAEHAEANAHEDAELVLSIAVCPKCDERDPDAARAFATRTLLGTLGLLALGIVLALVCSALMSARSGKMGLFFGIATGVLAAGAGIYVDRTRRRATWQSAPFRVTFLRELEERKAGQAQNE